MTLKAPHTPIFNIPYHPENPNYDSLTTVVRLCGSHHAMIETRDEQGRYAWFAVFSFDPETGDWRSRPTEPVPSKVEISMHCAPNYADEDRVYGDDNEQYTDPKKTFIESSALLRGHIDLLRPSCTSFDINQEAHYPFLRASVLEWTLNSPVTIHRFFHELESLRLDDHTFPPYISDRAYPAHKKFALNHEAFFLALLQKFLPIEEIGPFPETYFSPYPQVKGWLGTAEQYLNPFLRRFLGDSLREEPAPTCERMVEHLYRSKSQPLPSPRFVLKRTSRCEEFVSCAQMILFDMYRRHPLKYASSKVRAGCGGEPSEKIIMKHFPCVAYRLLEEEDSYTQPNKASPGQPSACPNPGA